jgi:hypothetical protein
VRLAGRVVSRVVAGIDLDLNLLVALPRLHIHAKHFV